MEQIVSGCKDCCFYHDGERYEYAHYCKHPNSPQSRTRFNSEPEIKLEYENGMEVPITPDFCPLNSEPITIKKV